MDRKPLKEVISVPEGQLWLILFFVSLSINAVQLLWRPILNLLHRKHEVR